MILFIIPGYDVYFHQFPPCILSCETKCPTSKLMKVEMFLDFWRSACAEQILDFVQEMGVRAGPQGSWLHPTKSLPEFLGLWNKYWSCIQTFQDKRLVLEFGLSASAEWTLDFVQEMGVRAGPQGSWFHPTSSLGLWSKDWSYIKIKRSWKLLRIWTCTWMMNLWLWDKCNILITW